MLQGLLGIFSGLITPVQTAVNTRLGRSIGSPLRASLVSFSVGLHCDADFDTCCLARIR